MKGIETNIRYGRGNQTTYVDKQATLKAYIHKWFVNQN